MTKARESGKVMLSIIRSKMESTMRVIGVALDL